MTWRKSSHSSCISHLCYKFICSELRELVRVGKSRKTLFISTKEMFLCRLEFIEWNMVHLLVCLANRFPFFIFLSLAILKFHNRIDVKRNQNIFLAFVVCFCTSCLRLEAKFVREVFFLVENRMRLQMER